MTSEHTPEPWHVVWLDDGAAGRAGPALYKGDSLVFEFNSLQHPRVTGGHADFLNEQAAEIARLRDQVRRLREALTQLVRQDCICGHAKSMRGNSHFFGDSRPDEPRTAFCMRTGCDCKVYQPDYRVEAKTLISARTLLAELEEVS